MSNPNEVPTSIRLHRDLVARIDALVEPLSGDAELAPAGRLSRSDVIRLCLLRGLPDLEAHAAEHVTTGGAR